MWPNPNPKPNPNPRQRYLFNIEYATGGDNATMIEALTKVGLERTEGIPDYKPEAYA